MSKHRLERPSRIKRAALAARAATPTSLPALSLPALPSGKPLVLAASAAALATGGTVTAGVLLAEQPHGSQTTVAIAIDPDPTTAPATATQSRSADDGPVRTPSLSRAFDRASEVSTSASARQPSAEERMLAPAAVAAAVAGAHDKVFTTTQLNLWTAPGDSADQVGELDAGKRVLLTGRSLDGRDEVVVGKHRALWVTQGYTTDHKPPSLVGLSDAPCPDSSVEYRLVPDAVRVYRAVCHAFPQISTYGGWDDHGEHVSGKALDIMTSDPTLLVQIADFLQAHASELNLYDIIRLQHIWTPVRASEGWRSMPDRGSPTANHMDHVHVSVN